MSQISPRRPPVRLDGPTRPRVRHPSSHGTTCALLALCVAVACGEEAPAEEALPETPHAIQQPLLCTTPSCTCNASYALSLIQSTNGVQGNFELVAPAAAGGLAHYYRDNDTSWDVPWSEITPFASGDVNGVSLIQSNYLTQGIGSLHAVYVVGSDMYSISRDDGATYTWSAPVQFASGVRGTPGLIQSLAGTQGNFEVVVPKALGGLIHYYRDNDLPSAPWTSTSSFGGSTLYDAVALIQSNFEVVGDDGGNLELIARTADTLHHFYRDGTTGEWIGPFPIASGVQGSPALIQSVHGFPGDFELVTPLAAGGMAHFYRDNSDANYPWIGPTPVLGVSGSASAVSIIQSNYGAGRMEWVARVDGELLWGSRDDGEDWQWHGPHVFSAQPCCDPATKGHWADAVSGEIVAIHAAVLRNRKVLFFGFSDADHELGVSRLFDPATSQVTTPDFTTGMHPNLFCGGQSALPDGRIFVSGGDHDQLDDVHVYSPTTNQWSHAGVMNDSRWYPTTATLANGRVFMISGTAGSGGSVHDWHASMESPARVNNTWQVYNGWSLSRAVTVTPAFSPDFFAVDLYPFVYLLPNGKLLVHSRRTTRLLTLGGTFPNLTGSWDASAHHTVSPHPRTYPRQGSSVLLPLEPDSVPPYRAKVLISGGAGALWPAPDTPATASVELLDLGATSPSWRSVAPMNFARLMHDAVLLPDGTVLAVGGSAIGRSDEGSAPVLTPEVYDPPSDTWVKLCPMRVPRSYHSIALLLPDARVLVAGKDGLFNAPPYRYPEKRVEIFSPPYLFAGTRPTITSAPTAINYGQSFTVGVGAVPPTAIARVALLRLGTTTHGVNMDQRHVGVRITARGASTLTLTAPPNGNVAPPGYYMLFLLTTGGVPSVSAIVRVQ